MSVEINEIAMTSPLSAQIGGAVRWRINATTDDLSEPEELIEAPGAGYQLVLSRLQIVLGDEITVTISDGLDTGGAELPLLGPLGGVPGVYEIDWREAPAELTPNSPLVAAASAEGQVCIIAEGFTRSA